jgi:hypothetical protein
MSTHMLSDLQGFSMRPSGLEPLNDSYPNKVVTEGWSRLAFPGERSGQPRADPSFRGSSAASERAVLARTLALPVEEKRPKLESPT